eukprot:8010385-Pyramimonas_sp.AAC.1
MDDARPGPSGLSSDDDPGAPDPEEEEVRRMWAEVHESPIAGAAARDGWEVCELFPGYATKMTGAQTL